jgi:hypothetical protein
MLKTWMAPAAAAFAVLLLAGSVDTAEAYKWGGGGGKYYGGKVYGGKFYGGPKFYGGTKFYGGPKVYGGKFYGNKFAHFHHRHRFIGVGVPLAYGYGYYAYSNSCYWLRRRAIDTGNPYWWDRYYACLDGGYYD